MNEGITLNIKYFQENYDLVDIVDKKKCVELTISPKTRWDKFALPPGGLQYRPLTEYERHKLRIAKYKPMNDSVYKPIEKGTHRIFADCRVILNKSKTMVLKEN